MPLAWGRASPGSSAEMQSRPREPTPPKWPHQSRNLRCHLLSSRATRPPPECLPVARTTRVGRRIIPRIKEAVRSAPRRRKLLNGCSGEQTDEKPNEELLALARQGGLQTDEASP